MRKLFTIAALVLGSSLALGSPARAQEPGAEAAKEKPDAGLELIKLIARAADAQLHVAAQDWDIAAACLKKLIERAETSPIDAEMKSKLVVNARYNIACCLSRLGKKDDAIAELKRAIDAGYRDWKHIEEDDDLAPIRGERAFKEMIEKARFERENEEGSREAGTLVEQVKQSFATKKPAAKLELDVTTIDGKRVKLADLKGKVVVVSWFVPIEDERAFPEIALLAKLAKAERDRVVVVGLSLALRDDAGARAVLADFVKKKAIEYPVALVAADDPAARAAIESQAKLFFIDRDGVVRATAARMHDYALLERVVDAARNEKK